jgi:hypothetical protein
MRSTRFSTIAVLGLLIALVCVPMIRSSSAEEDAVRARFAALQTALDAYVPRDARNRAFRPELADELESAWESMQELPITHDLGTADGVGYPYQWAQEYREALRAELDARATFFQAVDALCAAAAEPIPPPEARGADDFPGLLVVRDVTNLCCARALCALEEPGGEAEAVRHLDTALRVTNFCDSGHLISLMIRNVVEGIVLGAVATAVQEHGSCPREIADFVRERFPPSIDRDRLALALRRELEFMAPLLDGDELELEEGVDVWKLLARHLGDYERVLDFIELPPDRRDRPPTTLGTTEGSGAIVNAAAWKLRGRWLAHLALALDAHLAAGGPWPATLGELVAGLDPALRPPAEVLASFELRVRSDGRWLHFAARDLPPEPAASTGHWCWR